MEMLSFFILGLLSLIVILLFVLLFRKKGSDSSLDSKKLAEYEKNLKDEFERNRKESSESNRESRKESLEALVKFQESINGKLDHLTKNTQESMSDSLTKFMTLLSQRVDSLAKVTAENLEKQQQTVQTSLKDIQQSNEQKLEQMRMTVDEKLQSTLEKRLTGSFEIVSKQLEAVQKGLGEMQNLASDVGGLKRALTNVKIAGGMGEVQLEALLSQFLSPEQYEKNAHPNPAKMGNVVEFAVKIPSKESDFQFIYLPIDAKYPATVWDKLTLAYEKGSKEEIEANQKALATEIKKMAKDISEKYIEVPFTTDFGILFLPFEGLYSEVLRIPGLFQTIQNDFKVTISGPTTLNAFLNSLQMGFRTLAIQRETGKIWDLLNSVKKEFGRFGDVLTKTKQRLESATKEIESAQTRSRAIEKQLGKIDSIAEPKSSEMFEKPLGLE